MRFYSHWMFEFVKEKITKTNALLMFYRNDLCQHHSLCSVFFTDEETARGEKR